MNSSTSFMFNLHLLGARSGPKVPARQNPSMVRPRYALHMPQLCPNHAQTMPNVCPNLSVTVEILITRLMPEYARVCQRCPRYAQDMPKICPIYAQDMQRIPSRYGQDMPSNPLIHGIITNICDIIIYMRGTVSVGNTMRGYRGRW